MKHTRIPLGKIHIGDGFAAELYYYGDFAFTLITNGIPYTRDETRNLYPTLLFDKIYLMSLNYDFAYNPKLHETE